jgi:hypothetical protein
MIFNLILIVSGAEYTILTGVDIHHCVGRLIYERQAIVEVQREHPELDMQVICRPETE